MPGTHFYLPGNSSKDEGRGVQLWTASAAREHVLRAVASRRAEKGSTLTRARVKSGAPDADLATTASANRGARSHRRHGVHRGASRTRTDDGRDGITARPPPTSDLHPGSKKSDRAAQCNRVTERTSPAGDGRGPLPGRDGRRRQLRRPATETTPAASRNRSSQDRHHRRRQDRARGGTRVVVAGYLATPTGRAPDGCARQRNPGLRTVAETTAAQAAEEESRTGLTPAPGPPRRLVGRRSSGRSGAVMYRPRSIS